ncbi:MAG TPA: diguanylate cyclase [Geobacteraceae bacterium]|nr:diguanylate cyclase [Geobacteraceae bacterium]
MEQKSPAKKVTLINKLLASYAAISFFTIAALSISYTGLYSLTKITRDIVTNDFVVIDAANKLRESILAQQSYAAKFAILKEPEFRELYLQREAEFLDILQGLQTAHHDRSLDEIAVAYRDFRTVAYSLFQDLPNDPPSLKPTAEKVAASIEKTLVDRQKLLGKKLEAAKQKEQSTIRWTLFLSASGFLIGLCVAALLIFNISTAVRKLKKATHRIAEGDFDFNPDIPPGDEVGDLAVDFTRMAKRLKELEQMSLDASPLTRLPGNIAIEQVLEAKLDEGKPFAVCYADLDNFKAYNDRYGYISGSELIKSSGEIIYEMTNACDSENAFVGHVGGDDFVMVVSPEKAAEVCKAVIERFDRDIPSFYSPEDRANKAIEGPDRYGVHRRFPLMTISIAIIICQKGAYDSAVSIAKAAAEMKKLLKAEPRSNYSINRRLQPR